MKFVYTTDLHGDIRKYQDVLHFAKEHEVQLIHLGADLLPKGSGILKEQKKFVKGFLKNFYLECQNNGIVVLAFWGNDDIYTRKSYFKKYAALLDEKPYSVCGFDFKAYGYVPDYPFGLKTACKLDYPGWKIGQKYFTDPVDVGSNGFYNINDIEDYFRQKGTIENDLKSISGNQNLIMAIHCPPQGLDLDVCIDGRRVGSKAVLEWITKEQPMMVLCGHIHESPKVTGVWKRQIGNSLVIQPGQEINSTTLVYIEIEKKNIQSSRISIQPKEV